tara:strand:+ start:295 stop:1140 length:846 start_codon:yes stop_codon:yes gene_type:complete
MTIAITAVSGHLGQAIARTLIAMPGVGPVVGLARTPAKASGLGIEVRPGDYTRPDQLKASLAGVDTLLLVSGMDAPEARIGQHRNVIEAARAAGVSKIVYTSIQGPETGTTFSPVVQSNRQTEADIRASGLAWAIGRNGIYIEPDIEYIDSYRARGEIANSAGDGRCGYTTRAELGQAYASLLTGTRHDGQTVNLHGDPITQTRLADLMNTAFGTDLVYRALTPAEYLADRSAELGDFLGGIIAGIYDGIRLGAYDNPSDFEAVTGRPHQDWEACFRSLQA